jgi:AcrR family transcriptional regulator
MASNQRHPDETRARILDAAQAAFAEQGYDRASVAEICRAAGVAKGGFYHHFESKHALFLELLSQWLDELDERLAALERSADTVPEQLVAMTGVVGHVLAAAGAQLSIYLEYLTQALRDPALQAATAEPYLRYHRRIAALVQRGVQEGALRPVQPEATASVILALVMGLLVQALLAPDAADWEQAAAEGLRILLRGLSKE